MSIAHRITDLKRVYVSYGPFDEIVFNSIDLNFYRDDQDTLTVDFKYDIHFGNHDDKSDKNLFIAIDVREVPDELRDDEISFVYQTSSFVSDVKDKSFHIVNDNTSKISLPIKDGKVIYWQFDVDPRQLDNVRATADPIKIIDIPLYLNEYKSQGYGIVNAMNNIDMRKSCFTIRVDLEKGRSMIKYDGDGDLNVSFDQLDEEDKQVAVEMIMKDLPKFTLPQYSKEVNREVMSEYAKDLEDRTLSIEKQIKSCLLEWSSVGSEGHLGECRLIIHDTTTNSQGGYTYTPMHPKWFMNYN